MVAFAPASEAAIAFRSSSQVGTPYVQSFQINKPAGVVDGDVMVMTAAIQSWADPPTSPPDINTVLNPPAGWTLVRKTYLGDPPCSLAPHSQVLHTWYKVASGEPASYTLTFPVVSINKLAVVGILAFSGVDTSNPIDAEGGQANCPSSPNVTAPSITTTTANTWLVGGFAVNAGAPSPTYTPPPGMTERVDLVAGDQWVTLEVADEPWAPVGATGTRVAVATDPNRSTIGHLLALRPAAKPVYYSVGTSRRP